MDGAVIRIRRPDLPDGTWIRVIDDRIHYWNLGAERLYGWTRGGLWVSASSSCYIAGPPRSCSIPPNPSIIGTGLLVQGALHAGARLRASARSG